MESFFVTIIGAGLLVILAMVDPAALIGIL